MLRIVEEALHNALRHARAERITVRLGADRVEVSDDGVGFDPRRPELRARHLGLTSMEERARELGGRAGDQLIARRGDHGQAGARRVIRILIVDDHAVVREGLRAFLELQDGLEVVGEAADGDEAECGRRWPSRPT